MHVHNRHLFDDLRALGRVQAPTRFVAAILDELELGDRFASLDTALGPVFVAWNRYGVSLPGALSSFAAARA